MTKVKNNYAGSGLSREEYMEAVFGNHPIDPIKITDQRDIKELQRRKLINGFQPPREELYSCNPNFDGNYSE